MDKEFVYHPTTKLGKTVPLSAVHFDKDNHVISVDRAEPGDLFPQWELAQDDPAIPPENIALVVRGLLSRATSPDGTLLPNSPYYQVAKALHKFETGIQTPDQAFGLKRTKAGGTGKSQLAPEEDERLKAAFQQHELEGIPWKQVGKNLGYDWEYNEGTPDINFYRRYNPRRLGMMETALLESIKADLAAGIW